MFSIRRFLPALVLLPVAGCTSLEGSPRPIFTVQDNHKLLQNYRMDVALKAFDKYIDDGKAAAAERYRNDVVALYINAIDAQYDLFRRKLNGQRKGMSLGLNLAILGFSGAIPLVADGSKDLLGALAGGAASSRTAADKELYFDQALPAMLAAMDAERIKAKAILAEGMRRPATEYSMAQAFIDLNAYQAAPSFDRAIDKLTAAASADRQAASAKLETAVAGCDVDTDLTAARGRVMEVLLRDDLSVDQLQRMALRVGADTKRNGAALTVDDQREAIRDRLANSPCDEPSLNLIAQDFAGYLSGVQ